MLARSSFLVIVVAMVASCATTTNPIPSPNFDGLYIGIRNSDHTQGCGISHLEDETSARIVNGQLVMDLFSTRTKITGTVGENGIVRGSGIWPNPTGGFPGITVLNGKIGNNTFEGTATDFRCYTSLNLKKVPEKRVIKINEKTKKPVKKKAKRK